MPSGPRPNKKTRAELRILNEIAKGECELDEKCFLLFTPEKKSYLKLKLVVTPPTGLWEGVPFGFELTFSTEAPNDYPNQQPKVRLMDGYKIYHPNIDLNGKVCLGLRKGVWRAALGIKFIAMGLLTILLDPNPDDPLNHEASKQLRDDPDQFERNVAQSLRGRAVRCDGVQVPFPSTSQMRDATSRLQPAVVISPKPS
jgi:ubiquitin-conjugating enzyme E2 M